MKMSRRSEFIVPFSISVNFSGIFGAPISQWGAAQRGDIRLAAKSEKSL
jgi:hypothetical protein